MNRDCKELVNDARACTCLSAYLFSVGLYGLITSRNMVRALMCLELILNAVNLNFVTFSDFFDSRQLKEPFFLFLL
uniref:Putative NADH-ubiquinone oxidoreductase chain 4L/K n=1 Tax=Helianthus annuus TaxID=4232 RepID=A0A251VJE5_HELAN